MNRFVRKPGHSATELLDISVLPEMMQLSMFGSLANHVRKLFTDDRIVRILEFPVLFLGGRAQNIPALYSLMNYADTALGTWYPKGGMHQVVEAMVSVAEGLGVRILYERNVERILETDGRASGVVAGGEVWQAGTLVAAADYHHVEQNLLSSQWRRYDQTYWDKRVMSPSSMLFYLGLNRRVEALEHHNLFFDVPFEPHAKAIYDTPGWPEDPLFYVCAPSRTDPTVAPEGCENLFLLVPLAAGLDHDETARQDQFDRVMDRLTQHLGFDLRPSVIYRRDYAHREFEADYNSYKGNAYGLANTLKQTAFLKPKMKSRLPGLFFAGQLTTPGPGVPPSLISGQMAATEADSWLAHHEPAGRHTKGG
jgi:phytoene desaturase